MVPSTETPVATEVADGVYVMSGASEEVSTENLGRIGNAGFIVGEVGVIAIDTGTSFKHGIALLSAIRSVTNKPIQLALITHTRQEFLFGATAYQREGVPVQMHREAATLMRSRCAHCLQTLKQSLGDEAMRDTELVKPNREFEHAFRIEEIGRPVDVLYFGHSSGPGDIAVFDLRSGVLFAGGLLDQGRIPDVQDSDLKNWLHALEKLDTMPIHLIVPGHGPTGSPALVELTETYLQQLQGRVRDLLKEGVALSEVSNAIGMPRFANWIGYSTIHRRNASNIFLRFEREELFGPVDKKH